MLKIKQVNYLTDYKLKIKFENNEEKICNLIRFLNKGKFVDLKQNKELFKNIKNTKFAIEWQNGIDLSSDTLYMIGK